ncbi:MAG: putative 4-hydroxybenzoate polyprenyltransferase [Euryarchaeota archaeon]|nr:putative 4-hydroxybenzoate polyprenyltransferase [Euryarchaeota archaeon]
MATLRDVLRYIRVEHSVFALPFVYIGILLAPGQATWSLALLVTLTAVGARGTAMSLNRIVDRAIDARNPRTAGRELPSGRLGLAVAWGLTVGFALLYFTSTHLINPYVFRLSPIPLAVFLLYPYTKRFTWACHIVLGVSLGIAPVGAWLAVTGGWVEMTVPLLLAFGVMFWVAGFDIIYALLDVPFDRANGVHSIPADLGERTALVVSSLFHIATAGCFAAVGFIAGLGAWYWVGLAGVSLLLLYEHATLVPTDPASVNRAAFTFNGYTGFVLLAAVAAASEWGVL